MSFRWKRILFIRGACFKSFVQEHAAVPSCSQPCFFRLMALSLTYVIGIPTGVPSGATQNEDLRIPSGFILLQHDFSMPSGGGESLRASDLRPSCLSHVSLGRTSCTGRQESALICHGLRRRHRPFPRPSQERSEIILQRSRRFLGVYQKFRMFRAEDQLVQPRRPARRLRLWLLGRSRCCATSAVRQPLRIRNHCRSPGLLGCAEETSSPNHLSFLSLSH